ncbi:MAG: DUF2244 domain-containing protein [Proteobacteria bacterium]|nr:DUF2244 domain-containing protein [Pseudomonadota bacterium]
MTGHDPTSAERPRASFRAALRPNRSLGPRGRRFVLALAGGVALLAGLGFALAGAWPVCGFLGLDAVVLVAALRALARAQRRYETVEVTETRLTVTRVDPAGRVRSWEFNPYWVRIEVGASAVALGSHGRRVEVGACLSPAERRDFAEALAQALARGRSAPASGRALAAARPRPAEIGEVPHDCSPAPL